MFTLQFTAVNYLRNNHLQVVLAVLNKVTTFDFTLISSL